MSGPEVEALFKNLTKSVRTTGVEISITKLTEKVFRALDALLIERMRDSVAKSMKPLSELVAKHDANKDGAVEYLELENLLLECQLAFKPVMFRRVCEHIFDPAKKAGKVTLNTLKFYLVSDSQPSAAISSAAGSIHQPSSISGKPAAKLNYDIEPSKDTGLDDTSPDELVLCRSGARKILSSF